ncbi:hypothetical protein DL98DRAFT_536004 [Cadophora sp. DSE1049]|nr:hypothetical protein DL98DRAFT_536004 [Cadophora sp. DSE1049]
MQDMLLPVVLVSQVNGCQRMRNTQNLQLAQLQRFTPMAPNMLQLAQLQQPLRPQRMGAFIPPFIPPVLPSPMMAGDLTPAAMYQNVAYPSIFPQPHCHHQQTIPCHHHDSDNHSNCRGRRGCSGSHGHSSLDSPFNRGSRSRSHSRSHSHSRCRSRSRSPSLRANRVQIINSGRRSYPFYSTSGSSLYITIRDETQYRRGERDMILKIPLSASIRDIWECLRDLVESHQKYDVDVYRIDGLSVPLNDIRSVNDLRANEDVIDCFVVFER